MRLDPASLLAEGIKDYAWDAYQVSPPKRKVLAKISSTAEVDFEMYM